MKHLSISETVALYIMSRSTCDLMQLTRYSIAEKFGMNQSYLSKRFKNDLNISILSYIDREKVIRSRIIIENEKKITVENISQILGIAKPQQFRIKFKRLFCTTPGRFIYSSRKMG